MYYVRFRDTRQSLISKQKNIRQFLRGRRYFLFILNRIKTYVTFFNLFINFQFNVAALESKQSYSTRGKFLQMLSKELTSIGTVLRIIFVFVSPRRVVFVTFRIRNRYYR